VTHLDFEYASPNCQDLQFIHQLANDTQLLLTQDITDKNLGCHLLDLRSRLAMIRYQLERFRQ